MKKLQYSSIGVFLLIAAFSIWMCWASATPQDNYAMSQTQVARNTYNKTYGAEQITILAQIATSPQTNYGLSLTQIERNKYNRTYGATQVIVSTSTGLQIPFINTTSLTEGDMIYYDSTGEEWDNTQGQINISGIGSSPAITLENPTHEDTDGGRESALIFKGQQSGGESANLAKIQGSHDGTSDDTKADLIFYTNNGTALTEAMRIDSNQHMVLPQENSPTAPTLAFGDGDSGLYEEADDDLSIAIAGSKRWGFSGNYFSGIATGSTSLNRYNGVEVSPAYTFLNDYDTGIWRVSPNILAISTNATEAMRIDSTGEIEAAFGIVPAFKTADPCGSGFPEGAIFYNDTANVLCFCDGTNDLKVSDGSACF